jgi:Trk-type K+ transport system membrane component
VVLLAVSVVAVAIFGLLWVTDLPLDDVAFEAVSGFGTAGLSTGISPLLPAAGQLLMVLVMLVGRVGPVTLGTALVTRFRTSRIRYPEEAPLIG